MESLFPKDRHVLRLTTASVGAALWGILLLGFYGLLHCPIAAREEFQSARIEELKTLLRDNANVHSAHDELTQTVAALESQIATIRRRIPNEPLEATFLSEATAIAEEEQVHINNFRRQAIDTYTDYSEVEVMISGTGSFASISRFLHRVSQLERLSTVRRMSLETHGANDKYPFDVVYALQFGMHSQVDEEPTEDVL